MYKDSILDHQQQQILQRNVQSDSVKHQQRNNLLRMMMLNNNLEQTPQFNNRLVQSQYQNPLAAEQATQWQPQAPQIQQPPYFLGQDQYNNAVPSVYNRYYAQNNPIERSEIDEVNDGQETPKNDDGSNGLHYKIVHLKFKVDPQNGSNVITYAKK